MTAAPSWAVVGGGVLGLTMARRLARAGGSVTLFEAAPTLGGLASAWQLGDITWDRHYHVTLLSDSWTRGILRELGLEDEMRWVVTRTGFWDGTQLSSISSTLEYLRLPALGMIDKMRIAATILVGAHTRDWKRLERTPVDEWLVRLSGRAAFEKLWRPLLVAKLGDRWRETSAAFLWATIQRLYAARRSGLKHEMFGYVPGGYARILQRYAETLGEQGVEILTASPVQSVRREGDRHIVSATTGDVPVERSFDQVVVTTPFPLSAQICSDLTSEERGRLRAVDYQGVVCASLLLDRPLSPYYLTYLTKDLPFTAVVEMTAFVDSAEVGGKHLVYLPRYVPAQDPFFAAPDADIEEEFLGGLRRVFPDFDRRHLRAFRVSRARHVFPLPKLRYSETLPPTKTSVQGLHLASSGHIVNGTLNVNETIQLAELLATEILDAAATEGAAA